ncbi:MAG: hypothetical protein E7265_03855 [Lachnospiraceae bacterium]|nr:hypothetical protein [Lachnospiraceae bacterium]
MGILLVIVGLGWLIGTILKEEVFTKPAAPNTDYRQAFIDLNTGKISAKECDKRVTNGYYSRK